MLAEPFSFQVSCCLTSLSSLIVSSDRSVDAFIADIAKCLDALAIGVNPWNQAKCAVRQGKAASR